MVRALTPAQVIAGEAVSGTYEQRMADMRAIASVIANRAQMLGITPEQVVANSNEFNAYNRSLPPGVGQGIIDMAQQAIDEVNTTGPTNNATFYATPAAVDNLPGGLSYETATDGHQYFSDPQGRAIGSSLGYIQPNLYGYAQNPANVPTPTSSTGLLSDWSQMASAGPMTAPMGSVTASGLLGSAPNLEASATVNPMLSLPATADLGMTPGFSASSLASVDTPSSRMGLAEPSFDMSRFDGAAPSVASGFDQGRFASPETAAFDASRFGGGLLNPATNTQSFMDQPASLGSMPDAYAAQRGPSTGMLSADFQTIQGLAEKQLAEQSTAGLLSPATAYAAEPSITPAQQAIADQTNATGLLGTNPGFQASATVPSLPGAMTPSQIAGYQQMAASAPNITNLSGFTGIFDDGSGYQNAAPVAAQVPDLQQVSVPDQPTIATVDGPATTPAVEQQAQQDQQSITAPTTANATQQQTPSQSTLGSKLSKAINPGTIGGGLLGGLALGPAGGIVGGLLGNAAYNGGLFGASQPMAINNIGGGLMNTASIWGGSTPAGTQATASDGQTITSMGNGYTAITGKSGVTTVFDNSGKAMSYFGGALGNDDAEAQSSNSGGGFFGGLFG